MVTLSPTRIYSLIQDIDNFSSIQENEIRNVSKLLNRLDTTQGKKLELISELAHLNILWRQANKLLDQSYIVGDMGTGETWLYEWKLDRKEELVSLVGNKVEVKRDSKLGPEFFVNALKEMLSRFKESNIFMFATSWARTPSEVDQKLIGLMEKLTQENSKMFFKVLSQLEEADGSDVSLKHSLDFKDPDILSLKNVTSKNTIQVEGGKGSCQSRAILPTQKVERAAAWVNEQLSAKQTPTQIIQDLKEQFQADFKGPEAMNGIENIVIQGSLAVALENEETIKLLNIDKNMVDDWNRGHIPLPLMDVIKALRANVQICEKAGAPEKNRSVAPLVVCLAMLEAISESYGIEYRILNMRKEMRLKTKDFARVSGSHGNAVKYFKTILNIYNACINRQAEILALLPPLR